MHSFFLNRQVLRVCLLPAVLYHFLEFSRLLCTTTCSFFLFVSFHSGDSGVLGGGPGWVGPHHNLEDVRCRAGRGDAAILFYVYLHFYKFLSGEVGPDFILGSGVWGGPTVYLGGRIFLLGDGCRRDFSANPDVSRFLLSVLPVEGYSYWMEFHFGRLILRLILHSGSRYTSDFLGGGEVILQSFYRRCGGFWAALPLPLLLPACRWLESTCLPDYLGACHRGCHCYTLPPGCHTVVGRLPLPLFWNAGCVLNHRCSLHFPLVSPGC